MAAPTNEALFLIKDVKPGSKNLNIVFIVLEIGKYKVAAMSVVASPQITRGS